MLLRTVLFLGVALLSALLLAIPPGSLEEITERIKPVGRLCQAGDPCATAQAIAAAPAEPREAMEIYQTYCLACHASGVSNAPIFGDTQAWAPRIAKGVDVLYGSTLNGLNLMPAKGICTNCSDDELRATVDYMLEQAR